MMPSFKRPQYEPAVPGLYVLSVCNQWETDRTGGEEIAWSCNYSIQGLGWFKKLQINIKLPSPVINSSCFLTLRTGMDFWITLQLKESCIIISKPDIVQYSTGPYILLDYTCIYANWHNLRMALNSHKIIAALDVLLALLGPLLLCLVKWAGLGWHKGSSSESWHQCVDQFKLQYDLQSNSP